EEEGTSEEGWTRGCGCTRSKDGVESGCCLAFPDGKQALSTQLAQCEARLVRAFSFYKLFRADPFGHVYQLGYQACLRLTKDRELLLGPGGRLGGLGGIPQPLVQHGQPTAG